MAQIDAALEIDVVGRHVGPPDRIVDACARPTHRRHDEIAGRHAGRFAPDGFDDTEAFVTVDQVFVAGRWRTIFARKYLLVGAVDPDREHANEHAVPVLDQIDRRCVDFNESRTAAGGKDRDGFHDADPAARNANSGPSTKIRHASIMCEL